MKRTIKKLTNNPPINKNIAASFESFILLKIGIIDGIIKNSIISI